MGPRPLTVGTEPGYGHLNAVAWVSAKISSALAVTASSRYLRAAHHPATHPITHPSRPPPPARRSGLTVKTLGDVTVTQVGGGVAMGLGQDRKVVIYRRACTANGCL